MKFSAAALSAILAVSCSSLALAGPATDAAARAEALQAEGKTVEALGALEEAIDAIWTQAPLAMRTVRLVEAGGTGANQGERANASFSPGDSLVVYLEPVGYGYGSAGGKNTIDFGIGLAIENATGQVLSEAPDLFSFSREVAGKRRDIGLTVAFKVPALYPADYKAIFTVRDRNSEKTASFEMPFTIAPPGGAADPAAEAGGAAPAAEIAPAASEPAPGATTEAGQPAEGAGTEAVAPNP
jgi:hypothetical protein